MGIGEMDRRIQFLRGVRSDGGLRRPLEYSEHGAQVWASRQDVSDGERAVAGWVEATIVSRFVVDSTGFSRGLTPKDRLVCDDLTFKIVGIKEIGRMDRLEITGMARTDVQ